MEKLLKQLQDIRDNQKDLMLKMSKENYNDIHSVLRSKGYADGIIEMEVKIQILTDVIVNNSTICVKEIPKANTFGQDGQWQIHKKVRQDITDHLTEVYGFRNKIDEGQIDGFITALYKLGYITLS
jgi:hypothetical protein